MRTMLTRTEFYKWLSYYMNKEPDETEIQLAVLTNIVVSGLGGKDSKAEDYLVNKPTKAKSVTQAPDNGVLTGTEVMSVFAGVAVSM